MRIGFATALVLASAGCFSSDPSSEVRPARDRWAVSPSGLNKATLSKWTGVLESRDVFDEYGGSHRVLVLTRVSGLNPSDQVSRGGEVLEPRPMPPVFYLNTDFDLMVTSIDRPLGPSIVEGVLRSNHRGGVLHVKGNPRPAYSGDPTTVPSAPGRDDERSMLRMNIWPVIRVEAIHSTAVND